jgi:ATP-binding cassette subfamily F protein 3
VGIVGPNGAGKTTLLRALLKQIEPLAGEVTHGPGVRIGYYDQKHRDLDEEHSLVEEIQGVRPEMTPDPVRNYLARLRFFGDDVFRKVKGLSGGERSRLALGKMMLVPRNLLALDEPTNHLDIPAREVLEEALAGYDGTLVVVSHDRYFLDRTVTKILELDGTGHAELHVGNWSDWRARKRAQAKKPALVAMPPQDDPKQQRIADREADRDAKRKREQTERRFRQLEDEIAKLESEHARIKERLASDHGGDWQKLHTLVEEERILSERLRSKMGEWEKLGRTLGL